MDSYPQNPGDRKRETEPRQGGQRGRAQLAGLNEQTEASTQCRNLGREAVFGEREDAFPLS